MDVKGKGKKASSDFFNQVYAVVRQIPEGRVTSYGAIARYLGAPQSARIVGYAMNAAHTLENVPAHRVVNRKGLLTGKHHFPGVHLMQQLLENEGVLVKNDQVQNFDQYHWDPNLALPPLN
jgi:methylated-DNA-protein-cysteine methyltransferase-like protein